jgi:outer membrane lipoprotein-sorting protein
MYCKKAVIYIDEKHMLPVSISLFDDEGLFESYTFSAIVVNRPFPKDEFLVSNKAYGF